jgi:hypothetical protein
MRQLPSPWSFSKSGGEMRLVLFRPFFFSDNA